MVSCFALVSGAASLVGENILHVGDFSSQVDETVRNQAVLSDVLSGRGSSAIREDMARYDNLRVSFPSPGHHSETVARFRNVLKPSSALELFDPVLCRSDLLLEVEGTLRSPG